MGKYRFKGIHNFINDVKYISLKEAPIDILVRRQIEDMIIIPRQEEFSESAQ